MDARVAGASRIFAIDLAEHKFDLARRLGATDTVQASATTLVEDIKAATGGGVNFAFEMAGSVKAKECAYNITKRGMTVAAGLPPPNQGFNVPHGNLVAEERTIKGSYIGTCVPLRDIKSYVALFRAGLMLVNYLLSHRLKLEDLNEGFERLHEGKAVRQIILF